jgi:hypothetical protein
MNHPLSKNEEAFINLYRTSTLITNDLETKKKVIHIEIMFFFYEFQCFS